MKIVVKIGSNVLTRPDGRPNVTNMSAIVDQISALMGQGHAVVLVSSGAVACGRGGFAPSKKLDSVAQRQLFSAIGQIKLINIYSNLFDNYGLTVGQVLTQKENFSSRSAYLNQRACIEVMIDNQVVPIVNENDTASMTELMFTDNDELSGLVASMIDADLLVILSNIDGIYTGNPADPHSSLIPVVKPNEDISQYIQTAKSGFGRGGMGTKYGIARRLADEGISVIIANGNRQNVLADLINAPATVPHTLFQPASRTATPIKRWVAHSASFAKGQVYVDAKAAMALTSDAPISLLPIGIVKIEGEWEEGDVVNVFGPDGRKIGVGRANVDSVTACKAIGCHGAKPIIHYDYLFLENNA